MRLLLALIAAFLVLTVPARAASPEVGIADDRILLAGGAGADQAIAEWQTLGVQDVRIYALWSRIAPDSPTGTDSWAQLDAAVNRVVAAGMKPILTITGPGPLWVSRRSERGEPRYDPDPKLYAQFAHDVAARYATRSTATSSGTSPTSPAGCARRAPARARSARRSRRTSTPTSCAPPTRRSTRPTRTRPC